MSPTRYINLIVIHCSATPSGKALQRGVVGQSDYCNAAQVIDDWHRERGFKRNPLASKTFNPDLPSIGYHFVIDLAGQVLTGRSLDEVGAHVAGHNIQSVGICLVGGQERTGRYTPAQWDALSKLVCKLGTLCHVPVLFHTVRGVCGHRDLSPDKNGNGVAEPSEWLKTCPGFDVKSWLQRGLKPLPENVLEVA